jgi:ABC-type multidrug transport system fused ATPase/permease subunit
LASVFLVLLSSGLNVVDNYVNTRIAQGMTLAYRSELFEHSLRLPLSYHDRRRKGALMFTINSQSAVMGDITVALLPLVQNALTVIGMLVVAARSSPASLCCR